MFGYASDETEECMPMTLQLAHALNARLRDLRVSGSIRWLRPDSKSQVCLPFVSFLSSEEWHAQVRVLSF